jgi:hypothetical protein
LALAGVVVMAGCAVAPPAGPSVTALPGPGKSLDQFNGDDTACRNYAADRTQNAPAEAAAASQNANASIAAGTLIGAAAGAALGSINGQAGTGAAIGAGTGLLAGASVAGDQAQGAADDLQAQYDRAYSQCMVGNGEAIQGPPGGYAAAPAPADDVLPAAIAGAGVAAVLLSTQKSDHDNGGGYTRPDHVGGTSGGGAPAGVADVAKKKKDKKAQNN